MSFTESTYENAVIQLFESMGYTHIYAPDMGREDSSDPLMDGVLRDALVRINRGLPLEAIGEALSKIRNFEGGSLVEKNRVFTGYLQDGVEVNYTANGETRAALVRLVDFEKPGNNDFAVVNQYTYIENGNNRRPDIILFVNGLPLVLMELKSPSKEDAGVATIIGRYYGCQDEQRQGEGNHRGTYAEGDARMLLQTIFAYYGVGDEGVGGHDTPQQE